MNPSLRLLHSAREEGAAGAVALATSAKKLHGKKAPGRPQTFKVSNNFGAPRRRNPPQAAKLDGREIELGTPKKRPAEGTPRRMAQGKEVKFPFRLDCKRAYATRGAQARPPAVAAKYNNPDNRANQRPYGGHEKAGAPNLPAKGRQGLIFASSDKDNSDGDDIVRGGATKPVMCQASAATKDGHGVRTVRADKDDPDNDESASAGARYQHGSEPRQLRPSSTAGSAGPLARPRAGTTTRSQAAVRTARTATTVRPWAPKN